MVPGPHIGKQPVTIRMAESRTSTRPGLSGRRIESPQCTNMFLEPTTIHHDLQSGLPRTRRGPLVDHALLEPYALGLDPYGVIDDGAGLLGPSKDIHQIDPTGDSRQGGIGRFAQHAGFVRVHRDDHLSLLLHVSRHAVRRPRWIRRQSDHGNGSGSPATGLAPCPAAARQASRCPPELFQPLGSPAIVFVELVPDGILLVEILVIVFRRVKLRSHDKFRHDRLREPPGLLESPL